MNHALAREIYGAVPWHIDAVSFAVLQNVLTDARNGVYDTSVKNNTPYLVAVSDTKFVTRTWQLNNTEKFEGIGVINIDGAIVNSGGGSTYGMLELSSMMKQMAKDERVKGFIVLGNSGGGSSIAVETMGDAITEVRKVKPVYGLIEKGGTAASAMYMIMSYTEKIFAQSEMTVVGSNGTMIEFSGYPKNKEVDGKKHIRLYATKSVKKNEGFEEALNNDNYEVIINEMLDPINNRANARTLKNRPQLEGTNFDNGKVVFAKDGVGTFIDGFASFEEVANMILSSTKIEYKSNNNLKITSKMTKDQLKSEHPAIYQEIYNEGVKSEKDRSGAWLAHLKTDSQAVLEGIESGERISETAREKFLVKANSTRKIEGLESASQAPVNTVESETIGAATTEGSEKEKEIASVQKEMQDIFKGL